MFIHLVLIPIYLAIRIKQNVVTPRVRAHESYLLRRELELEFNINNKFYTEKIYLFSLFRRRQGIHLNELTTMSTVVFTSYTTRSHHRGKTVESRYCEQSLLIQIRLGKTSRGLSIIIFEY